MNALRFFFILVSTFTLIVIVMNQSISSYIEQRYHFAFYPKNHILKEANSIKVELEQIKAVMNNEPPSQSGEIQSDTSHTSENNNTHEEAVKMTLGLSAQDENLSSDGKALDLNQTVIEKEIDQLVKDGNLSSTDDTKIEVKQGEEFLLIGDSLMQGVAIALSRDLKDLGIKTTNLSKQNTGLSYKSYFDWASTTNSTLKNNPRIKYLVALFGVNDPWDIKKDGVYYRFNTSTWTEIYTERVKEIIDVTKKHKVKLFWFGIPPVKKGDLNEKIQVLNQIYSTQVPKGDGIFINTGSFFSIDNTFSSYIKDENNRSIKVRTDDGVHFTPRGAKEMSKLLLEYIVKTEK